MITLTMTAEHVAAARVALLSRLQYLRPELTSADEDARQAAREAYVITRQAAALLAEALAAQQA